MPDFKDSHTFHEAVAGFIRGEARRLGLSACGFAAPLLPTEIADNIAEWIGSGYHGSMAWMAREGAGRADARTVFPDAKSVVCLALNYYSKDGSTPSAGSPRISRYARFRDYHKVLGRKLDELLKGITAGFPGVEGVTAVDRHPIAEKAFAEAAGIGWIGKNTCLINKRYGSWVFLGEIILNVELPAGTRHKDYCGACTRCIDACPTNALVAPYVLDATKCISYVTIETDAPIPDEISFNAGTWVFGCDICQDVCPWSRKNARETEELDFVPRPELAYPTWEMLETVAYGDNPDTDADTAEIARGRFLAAFAGTPVARAGVPRFRNNVRRGRMNAARARAAFPHEAGKPVETEMIGAVVSDG